MHVSLRCKNTYPQFYVSICPSLVHLKETLHAINSLIDQLTTASRGLETEDMHLARDSLEVMSLSLVISPQVLASSETSQD